MSMRKHNFYAGPAVLPLEVLVEASRGVLQHDNIGLSIIEISHRSKDFGEVIEEAEHRLRRLMNIPDDYAVLFLQGGARLQFAMIPMNFLGDSETAVYTDTGEWARQAIEEAKLFGKVHIGASSRDENYSYIPKEIDIPDGAKYLHITTNNTIYGTQWHSIPDVSIPLVADMSSDILSRQLDVSKFAIIYAGAQKNAGTAGVTIVIIRKDFAEQVVRPVPSMLDYRKHISKKSLLNTPPVFAIYVSMLTFKWLESIGGIPEIERRNREKASLIYDVLDKWEVFVPTARKEDRSLMNITWRLKDSQLEGELLKMCEEANIVGIKGHRKVGGFRASVYNALPMESVKVLVDVLETFGRKYG